MFVSSPTGQLDAYIKNLERVLDAIEFFNQNNPNSLELPNLVCVYSELFFESVNVSHVKYQFKFNHNLFIIINFSGVVW